ncbi:hypothetical protein CW304_22825 [Bacillus sp. UFRGS-B20]|nr:hypothetical protein CW304_22825 [Bacillus sp. UFRGS-B20]
MGIYTFFMRQFLLTSHPSPSAYSPISIYHTDVKSCTLLRHLNNQQVRLFFYNSVYHCAKVPLSHLRNGFTCSFAISQSSSFSRKYKKPPSLK